MSTSSYGFRRMTSADLPLTSRWLQTPDVRRWWVEADGAPADPFGEDDLKDANVAMWIVSHAGRPFAFLRDYEPHAWPGHHFGQLPHGPAFIRAHVDSLFAAGAPVVGTDPHPANARAIRAYCKAGFIPGEARDTAWGLSLLMTRGRDDGGG